MITVRYRMECSDISHTYLCDAKKHWKAAALRGYDIAEMIAQEIWDSEALTIKTLFITEPAEYRGEYGIATKFIPEFTVAQLDLPIIAKPKKKH